MNGDGSCANCGNTSYIVDYERGDRVCDECGCVDSRLMVATANYSQVFDQSGTRRLGGGAQGISIPIFADR